MMKANKGCVNRECKAFTKKIKYKDSFEYCPLCSEKLEYVCADCWKVLDHNTTRFCEACKVKRQQKKEQAVENVKKVGAPVAGVVAVAWKNKDKVINVGKTAIKLFKR